MRRKRFSLPLMAVGCAVLVGAAVQPPAVSKTLRILVGLVPASLVLISALLLYFYPITEAKRQVTTTITMTPPIKFLG